MEGCTSSVVLSSSHILPKWSHWRVRQKKQQQFVACVIKITVRYETSSLPQWSHTIYASSVPPSARLDCVWNASHESTSFIPPQRRSLVGSSAQPKPHGAFANLSSPSAPHVFWGMLADSLVEHAHLPPLPLFLPCLSVDATICISHWRKVLIFLLSYAHFKVNSKKAK